MPAAAEIPMSFVDELHHVTPQDVMRTALGQADNLINLERRGLVVVAGLRPVDVAALSEIALQPGTVEYCRNDAVQRWGDEAMAEKQLAKDGGRAVFRLVSPDSELTYGFGWTGKAGEHESSITGCKNTFAIRLHERAQGQGLAMPFSMAIVAGSMAVYGMRGIGLETWGSNSKATRAYRDAHAAFMGSEYAARPTRIMGPGVFPKEYNGEILPHRNDVRIYMQYPWSF
jgi:hypothetical protein